MPSYQEYIDALLASGKVTHAAIFDLSGKPVAVSPNYNVTWEEGAQIANGFDLVNGMKGFDFWLSGNPHFVDSVLNEKKLIGHRKDPRIGREIVDEGNLAITNDRSIMAHANHIMLALEFSESNNKDVQRLVDQFLRKPPRG